MRKMLLSNFSPPPFEYVGGGIFRYNGIPKGQTAPIFHGNDIIKELEGYYQTCIDTHEKAFTSIEIKER